MGWIVELRSPVCLSVWSGACDCVTVIGNECGFRRVDGRVASWRTKADGVDVSELV